MKLPFFKKKNTSDEVVMIDIDKIKPNPYQPRDDFQEGDIRELAESIKNFGVIQPLTLRPRGDRYELIAGERRLRASKYLGLDKVPAIINDFDNQEMAEISLVENLQRKDLDFLEEALAYSRLLDEFGLTQKQLAEKLGKSQSTVANKLRLLNLPPEVRKEMKKSTVISERHARALLKLSDQDQQLELVSRIKEQALTVRETESLVEKILKREKEETGGSRKTVFKDLRVFTNTLNKTISEMKDAGLEIEVDKEEDEEFIRYHIRLPRE